MKELDLTIQIVNFKTLKYLSPLISSIVNDLASTKFRYEILILDNASGDDLSDIEKTWSTHNLKIYFSKVNGGFGAGNNFLEKRSSGKLILLINPDIQLIERNTISRLIKTLEITNASIAGPKLVKLADNSKELIREPSIAKKRPQLWDHGERTVSKDKKGNATFVHRNKTGKVAWVSGAFFLITRLSYEKLRGFDVNFFCTKKRKICV